MSHFGKRLREFCLAKPGAVEEYPWDNIVWKVKRKMFCATGQDMSRITVKATLEEQSALILHPHISVAAYVGKHGWVTIDLVDEVAFELALDLIDRSYELVVNPPKKRNR